MREMRLGAISVLIMIRWKGRSRLLVKQSLLFDQSGDPSGRVELFIYPAAVPAGKSVAVFY